MSDIPRIFLAWIFLGNALSVVGNLCCHLADKARNWRITWRPSAGGQTLMVIGMVFFQTLSEQLDLGKLKIREDSLIQKHFLSPSFIHRLATLNSRKSSLRYRE